MDKIVKDATNNTDSTSTPPPVVPPTAKPAETTTPASTTPSVSVTPPPATPGSTTPPPVVPPTAPGSTTPPPATPPQTPGSAAKPKKSNLITFLFIAIIAIVIIVVIIMVSGNKSQKPESNNLLVPTSQPTAEMQIETSTPVPAQPTTGSLLPPGNDDQQLQKDVQGIGTTIDSNNSDLQNVDQGLNDKSVNLAE